jgi:hypothetical protein
MSMSTKDEQFDAALAAFLDDDEAGLKETEVTHHAGVAFEAMERANAEADSHLLCGADDRDKGILVRVIGIDGISTYQVVPPERTFACVLGALQADDAVAVIQPIGWAPDESVVETETDGVVVSSPAGMTVTYEAAHLRPSPLRRLARALRPRRRH